ncbi:MAG: AsmA-like C-terminal region-containing protein [Planctomycetota bacterium]
MDARPREQPKRKGLIAQLGDFLRWMLLLALVTVTIASLGLYFVHSRLDEEIRLYVENKFQTHYPNLIVQVRSAHRVEGSGIELRGLSLAEPSSNGSPIPLLYVEELFAECGTELTELLAGETDAKRLVVRGVKLRATRFPDGSWNLSRLLPLPQFGDSPPPATIEGAFLEFVDLTGTAGRGLSLRDISLDVTPVASKEIAAELNGPPAMYLRGSFAADRLRRVTLQGQVNPARDEWDVQGEVEGLDVSSQTINALPDDIAAQLAPLRVATGTTNLSFSYVRQGATGKTSYSLVGKFIGRIEDPRLPQALMRVDLPFDLTNEGLKIQDATAQAGHATLQLSASLASLSSGSPFAFRLKAQQVTLSEQLAKPLTGKFREAWDKFSPQGTVDADITMRYDGRELRTSIVADLLDASLAYNKFPYRFQHARGQIRLHENVLEVDNVRAIANGRPVRIWGKLHNPGPDLTGWIDLSVDEPLPLDDKLFEAIQGHGEQIVRSLNPQGMIRVKARFERPDLTFPPRKVVAIELLDCSMRYDRFRYPIYNITGTILMDDDEWEFKNLEGYNDSAFVTCNGSWKRDPVAGGVLLLNFNATDVPLEDELRNACAANAQRFWHSLHPRGTIDAVAVQLRYEAAAKDLSVEVMGHKRPADRNVEGRSITIKPSWLPYELDEVVGAVRFRDGVAELEQVRGTHGDASVELSGRFETLPDDQWRFEATDIRVDRLRASHELVSALPQRLGNAISKLKFQGAVSISGQLGMQGMMGLDQPLASEWDLDLDVEDGTVDCGVRLEHIRGGMHIGGTLGPHGHFSRGQLAIDSLVYRGVQLTHVHGPLTIDDQFLSLGDKIRREPDEPLPGPLRAEALGGILVGSGRISMSEGNAFDLSGELFDGDLAKAIQELAPSRPNISGQVFASLRLYGNAAGAHTVKGAGEVQLRNADIYRLPLMLRMLALVRVNQPDRTAFTASDIDFRVEADRVYFDRIDFNGDVINLRGRGEMAMDRAINLSFTTSVLQRDGSLDRLLKPLFQDSGGLFEVSVTGTVDDPIVTRSVNQAFPTVFPEMQERRMSRTPSPSSMLERFRLRR